MYIPPEASNFFVKATAIDYNNWNPYFTYGRTNEEIAGIEFNDISINRKLAWFKTKKGEFKVKGQKIDVGFDFN